MKKIRIAIDGPAAAGKSTIAKKVAKKLGFTYIDTGAMYRAFTYYILQHQIDPTNEELCCKEIPHVDIELSSNGKVYCNGEDVTSQIREFDVARNVSYIASYKDIRLHLVELQRKIAKTDNVVMDGRDIGTYVLPHAEVKIFQVASVETRAIRRQKENMEKGMECTVEQMEEELRRRDYIDSHRSFAPLSKAEDAIELDTSDMTIEEVVNKVLQIVQEKVGEVHE